MPVHLSECILYDHGHGATPGACPSDIGGRWRSPGVGHTTTHAAALSKAEATATALKQELAAKISALDTEMKTSAALKEVSTGVQL